MAIPEMMSGAPENAAGADDGIVTEKTFVKFSTEYLRLNKKIIDNKQRVQRVRERIDMMIERRNRRVGAPEKAVDDEEKEEEEKSNIFGDILKKLLDLAKSLLKSFIFFAKKLLRGLLGFLFKLPFMKKTIDVIKKVFNGLLGKKLKLFKALGLGAVFGGLLALFSGSGSEAKEEVPPDFVGDGDDTEAPVVEEEVFVDLEEADFTDDDTIAPPVEPPPPVPKPKPPVPQRPPAAAPARPPAAAPKRPPAAAPSRPPAAAPPTAAPSRPPAAAPKRPAAAAPKRPAAAAPKPVGVPPQVSAPAKPQRVPEAVAKKQPGTPVKKESGDARAKKINDLILKENQLNDKIKEITFKTLPAAHAAADKKFPDGYQTMEAGAEAYAPEVAKLEQLLSKLKEEERQVSAQVAELYNQKRKADEGDFEISDKEFEMGGGAKTTTTVKKQKTVVQTKTETQTGGGSTVRTSAQKVDTEKTKELRAELKKVKAERRSIIKQLRAQGMGFGKATKDPRFLEIKARYEELEDLIEKSRAVVSAGSVTRTPGKNIRKTSTKVIVKPVVVKTETRVRQ